MTRSINEIQKDIATTESYLAVDKEHLEELRVELDRAKQVKNSSPRFARPGDIVISDVSGKEFMVVSGVMRRRWDGTDLHGAERVPVVCHSQRTEGLVISWVQASIVRHMDGARVLSYHDCADDSRKDLRKVYTEIRKGE